MYEFLQQTKLIFNSGKQIREGTGNWLQRGMRKLLRVMEMSNIFLKNLFYWSIVDLQCYVNFYCSATPILCPPDAKSWLIWKDPDAGKDWGQEEKGMTEDEMAGWHHRLNAHEFGWTPGVGDRQGGLVCCNSWGCKESDTTERLSWTELFKSFAHFYLFIYFTLLEKSHHLLFGWVLEFFVYFG